MAQRNTNSPDFRPRVALGMADLDATLDPGWPWRVDLGRLDMALSHQCVCGQLCDGGFWAGVWVLSGLPIIASNVVERAATAWAVARGLTLTGDEETDENWAALTDEWTRAIKERCGG